MTVSRDGLFFAVLLLFVQFLMNICLFNYSVYLDAIKQAIENAVDRNNTRNNGHRDADFFGEGEGGQGVLHESAHKPVCKFVVKHNSLFEW